jgi:D-aminoacyl-tRNA deacylase
MSDAYALFREGQKRLRTGMPAQATVPLEKAKKLEPQKASIREALGIAYFRMRNWEAAEREFRTIVEDMATTVVQRVSRAAVTPGGAIGAGVCVLLGVAAEDGEEAAARLAGKVARLRVFTGDDGKFDRSLLDTGGAALVVSQFTLIADTAKGNRPSFGRAARPELAEPLYERFCAELRALGVEVATGVFGAKMQVELVNDGPVTIILEI